MKDLRLLELHVAESMETVADIWIVEEREKGY